MKKLLVEFSSHFGGLEKISNSERLVITFSFVFKFETAIEQVLAIEPWSFDKHVVIFQQYDFSIPTRNLRFTNIIWVQLHGLPMSMLDFETAIEIGETIGTVSPSEHPKEMVEGDFSESEWRLMFQNLCVGAERLLSMPTMSSRSPLIMKNFQTFATGVVGSPM